MRAQRHQIRRQVYEVTVTNQALGTRLQNELSRIQRLHIETIVDHCCSELSAPDRLHRLGRIEVDLGELSLGNLENEIGERLSRQLRNVLGEHIREEERVAHMIGEDPATEAQVELIAHFATTGSLPFWADPSNGQVVDDAVAELQAHAHGLSQLCEVVVRDLANSPGALERLARHVDASRLRILLEAIVPASRLIATERVALVWELISLARTTWTAVHRSTIWAESLRISAAGESRREGSVAFARELVARIALSLGAGTSYQQMLDELWAKLRPVKELRDATGLAAVVLVLRQEMGLADAPPPPADAATSTSDDEVTTPKLNQRIEDVERTLPACEPGIEDVEKTIPACEPGIEDVERTIPACEPGIADPERPAPKARDDFAAALITFLDAGHAYADVADVPQTVRNALRDAADTPPTMRDALRDLAEAPDTTRDAIAHVAEAPPTTRDAFTVAPFLDGKPMQGVTNQPITGAPSLADALQRLPVLPAKPSHTNKSIHTNRTLPSFPAARRSPVRQEDPDEIYLTTAGLVLLWPFIATYFDRVGLLAPAEAQKAPQFLDHSARCRGVLLLHHLATGQDAPPEYRLPLEKLLCGLHLQEPFHPGMKCSEVEVAEAEALLSAVLAHAPNLGDITVQAFRAAFLSRRGVLSMRSDAWLLRVEKDAFDVVLGGLPWAVSWIRLPFMEAPLAVEWTV